jgi:hypothetical protein
VCCQASAIRKPAIRDFNDMESLAQEAREVDNTGTIASDDRFENYRRIEREKQERRRAAAAQGLKNIFTPINLQTSAFSFSAALTEEANKLDQASGGGDDDSRVASASASAYNNTPSTVNNDDEDASEEEEDEEVQIDEDLFADDLEDVEEQLRETNLTS